MKRLLLLITLFLPLLPAFCDEPAHLSLLDMQTEVMQGEGDYNFHDQILKTLFSLGMVVGLILLASWLMRRLSKNRMRYGNYGRQIKVVERRPLAPKTTLYLLDIAGRGIVIADGPGGVRTLYELPPEAHLEQPAQEEKSLPKPKFVDIFKKRVNKPC